MGTTRRALLFPGQGAHDLGMLEGVRHGADFAERYSLVSDLLHADPLRELAEGNREFLNRNKVSSLLTVLVSTLSLDLYLETLAAAGEPLPAHYAGYSVGQWTALYAAGALSFARLAEVIDTRADLMDACFRDHPGAMAAFIGVTAQVLDAYLDRFRAEGEFIVISNYNCLGQYSIAGSRSAVERAVAGADAIKPRKSVMLPVQGAWHCALLEPAAQAFAGYLEGVTFTPLAGAVIDNTTGEYFTGDAAAMRHSLARHISHPVLWEKGMRRLIADGCDAFVEIGYGELLTRFGFFIDRDREHMAFHAL